MLSKVSLSRPTVTRRIENMSLDVKQQLIKHCNEFKYFSVAVVESSDAKDTAQLSIFIRGIKDNFEIMEEFVQLMPLRDTTKGRDIFEAVLACFGEYELDLARLISVTTDGAPAMVGSQKGFVTLLENHMKNAGYENSIMKIHCIIHQEALCAKNTKLDEVMQVVVKIVNIILSRGLNHRQFRKFLEEIDAQHSDLKYFCDVRWLSRGNMLERFFNLLNEVKDFLIMKGEDFPQLCDPEWIANLAFLVDITKHLNKLNVRLQGKNQLVNILFENVLSFEDQLHDMEKEIAKLDFSNFPSLKANPPVIFLCQCLL